MLTELKQGSKVVGVKQTKRAVNDGKAARVFLAEDADPRVTAPVEALCAEKPDSGGAGSPDEGTGLRMRYRRAQRGGRAAALILAKRNNFHPFR